MRALEFDKAVNQKESHTAARHFQTLHPTHSCMATFSVSYASWWCIFKANINMVSTTGFTWVRFPNQLVVVLCGFAP